MAANQPTIPVKKPDGSVVRMTMSEFAAYKKGQKDDAPESAAPSSPLLLLPLHQRHLLHQN